MALRAKCSCIYTWARARDTFIFLLRGSPWCFVFSVIEFYLGSGQPPLTGFLPTYVTPPWIGLIVDNDRIGGRWQAASRVRFAICRRSRCASTPVARRQRIGR